MATANILSIKNAGLVAYDGSATFNGRTLTAGSSKITISNGDGVSANPSVDAVEANFSLNNIGGTLNVSKGGTGATTLTSNSLILGHGTSAVTGLGAATNGQLPIGSTGNSPVLATITAGTGITVTNGAGSIQIDGVGGSASAASTVDLVDDFFSVGTPAFTSGASQLGWTGMAIGIAGTGYAVGIASTSGHPGIVEVNTNTSSTGGFGLGLGFIPSATSGPIVLASGVLTMQFWLKIPTLSTGSERFFVSFGLSNADYLDPSFTQTDGVFFKYIDNVNSGKWTISTMSSSSATTNNTNSTVDTNWHVYKIIVNAAGTSVSFYIDGVEVSNSPIATNIPTVAVAPYLLIQKSVGTTNRTVQFDLFTLNLPLTTPR